MSKFDPDDLRTHYHAWRKAIETARDSCRLPAEHDDRMYWEHELEAFDRTVLGIIGDPAGEPISGIEVTRETPAPQTQPR